MQIGTKESTQEEVIVKAHEIQHPHENVDF